MDNTINSSKKTIIGDTPIYKMYYGDKPIYNILGTKPANIEALGYLTKEELLKQYYDSWYCFTDGTGHLYKIDGYIVYNPEIENVGVYDYTYDIENSKMGYVKNSNGENHLVVTNSYIDEQFRKYIYYYNNKQEFFAPPIDYYKYNGRVAKNYENFNTQYIYEVSLPQLDSSTPNKVIWHYPYLNYLNKYAINDLVNDKLEYTTIYPKLERNGQFVSNSLYNLGSDILYKDVLVTDDNYLWYRYAAPVKIYDNLYFMNESDSIKIEMDANWLFDANYYFKNLDVTLKEDVYYHTTPRFYKLMYVKGFHLKKLTLDNIDNINSLFISNTNLKEVIIDECVIGDDTNSINAISMFENCKSLERFVLPDNLVNRITNMDSMFLGCETLTHIPTINISNNTSLSHTFRGCSNLTTLPNLDTSNVTNMNSCFRACSSLQSLPNFDISKVKDLSYCFMDCSSLTTIPNFNTSNVSRMHYLFDRCISLQSIPLLDCGSVISMYLFANHPDLTNLTNIGGFKNLKVSNPYGFLNRCPNLTIESLMNVINNLWDWSGNTDGKAPLNDGTIYNFGTTHTLSFGQTNLGKLTEEQIAVATAKGWTLIS